MAMPQHDYQFHSTWRVIGTPAEVLEILADVESLPRWCPAVYLSGRTLHDGDEHHVGAVAELVARGWLGYALMFRLTITEVADDRCAFTSAGDLIGRGEWQLTANGRGTLVTFHWHVRLDKPLLRLSPAVLRPLFAANHDWAMAEGERALRLELPRRRARSAAEFAAVPAPPTGGHRYRVLGAVFASLLGIAALRRWRGVRHA